MKIANVRINAFIGDILFASSAAKILKEKYGYDRVHYYLKLPQPAVLLLENPYIDTIALLGAEDKEPGETFNLDIITQDIPATYQFQAKCGIKEEDRELAYKVYTNPVHDVEVASILADDEDIKHPILGIVMSWIEKSFLFTEKEYWEGKNIPDLGYGGRKHKIDKIVATLADKYTVLAIGLPPGIHQYHPQALSTENYSKTASLIKKCDYILGPEGGLTNLAAGVGTKVIMPTDFIAQLYGPNGFFKQYQNPQMGPATYFPDAGHSHLNPFADEQEIIQNVIDIIDNDKQILFDWNTLKKPV